MKLKKTASLLINMALVGFVTFTIFNYYTNQPSITNGQPAINFEFDNLKGKKVSLAQFKGEYIMLDFWASWCAPCRLANPELKAFQAHFKDKKVHVVSVSMDTSEPAWRQAILDDKLNWDNHTLDIKFDNKLISKWYDVKEIPAKLLISPEGKIVGVNLTFKNMTKLLDEKLKTDILAQ